VAVFTKSGMLRSIVEFVIKPDNSIYLTAIGEMVGRFSISLFVAVYLQIPISGNDLGPWAEIEQG
jgi:hypothetical protein